MIGTAGYAQGGGPSGPGENYACPPDCTGTQNDDTITGDDNHNLIYAKGGRDTVDGKGGDDELYGNGGPDTLYGREGNDMLNGGGGKDTLWGGTGNDKLYGGDGDDFLGDQKGLLTGDAPDYDELYGGDGNDRLDAHDGDELDKLDGGSNTPVSEGGGDYCIGEVNDKYYNCEDGQKWSVEGNQLVPIWTGNSPSPS